MDLSLTEASHMLGKTPRQVRYMIHNGRLPARKVGGRWLIESDALPLSEGQLRARQRKAHALKDAVEDALGPHTRPARSKYSVRQIAAFAAGAPLFRTAVETVGRDHPAVDALRDALVAVSRGCHRYHDNDKLDAYRGAREQASRAVALLLLDERDTGIADAIEQELLPALNGLIRRCERKRSR